jgi:hypothetical protein
MPQMAAAHDHQPLPSSYQPTVEDRQRARGGKYPLISPHERSTFSHLFNNPDLSCHILTSSPSIQIRSLPFVAHSTASFSGATMFAGILRRRRLGHDLLFLSCLCPPLNLRDNAATKPSVYPRQGRSRHSSTFDGPLYRICAALSTVYRTLDTSRTLLSLLVSIGTPYTVVDGRTGTCIYS